MTGIKTAFVTGAGSGIGQATCAALSAEGYHLALFGRRRERLEETAALCSGETLIFAGDVGVSSDIREAFAAVEKNWGRLDVLFNNAGTGIPSAIDALTDEQWDQVVRTNLTGSFYCAREAFALMRRQNPQGGRIINNGSISAHAPRPNSIAYTATKHAITGLTKSLSLDGRPFGISCGQIDIGNAVTNLSAIITAGIQQADGTTRPEPMMQVSEVVEALLLMTRLPPSANIQTLTIMATNMPFIGRG